MIRLAKPSDVEGMLLLVKEFVEQGPSSFEYNENLKRQVLRDYIADDEKFTAVNETDGRITGLVMGFVADHPFFGYKCSTEIVWYKSKDCRGGTSAIKLLKAWAEWSVQKGAKHLIVADVAGVMDNSELYRKLGFEKAERTYTMRVS